MRRKFLHRMIIIIFLAVLSIRVEQHFRIPHSAGFLLKVDNPVPPENCELIVPLVLHISANRALRLNLEPEARDQLSGRLTVILKERIRPVLYIDADPEITVQELAELLDVASQSNEKVQIRLITRGNRKYTCVDAVPPPAA